MSLIGSKSSGPINGTPVITTGGGSFTKNFLKDVGPGSNGYGSTTIGDRSGPGLSLERDSRSSDSSVSTGFASVDNQGAMSTTSGRTDYAADQVARLANSLEGTAYASRMGEVIGNQYPNTSSAIANDYGLAQPGNMPASAFSGSASAFSPNLSSMFGNNSSSAWGAVGGTVGSAFGGVGSAIGSAIGSYYGGSSGHHHHHNESMYDWFFKKIDELYKQINPKDPEKPGEPADPNKPAEPSADATSLSPEIQALKDTVSEAIEPLADVGATVVDSIKAPFQSVYNALTSDGNKDAKVEEAKQETQGSAQSGTDSSLSLFANLTVEKVLDQVEKAVEEITGSNESQKQTAEIVQEAEKQTQQVAEQIQAAQQQEASAEQSQAAQEESAKEAERAATKQAEEEAAAVQE